MHVNNALRHLPVSTDLSANHREKIIHESACATDLGSSSTVHLVRTLYQLGLYVIDSGGLVQICRGIQQ